MRVRHLKNGLEDYIDSGDPPPIPFALLLKRPLMIGNQVQPAFAALYHRAFADFRLRALRNVRELEHPTAEEALIITRNLRTEGDDHGTYLPQSDGHTDQRQASLPESRAQTVEMNRESARGS
jgi:hypothetical protein